MSQRFTTTTLNFAASRAFMHIISAFGLVYLTEWLGYWGLWFIVLPTITLFIFGVRHYEKLENQKKNEIHTPFSTKLDEFKLAR